MTAIRKSGSFCAYTWDGKLTDPLDAEFAGLLAAQRFRHIDLAASEEVSAGWVTQADPSGGSFDLEDLDAGPATWLRVRVDTKKLPGERVKQRMAEWRREHGKPPTARQCREIKDALAEELLPKQLPTTKNIDALLYAERRIVLLFAAGKSARETFGKLWLESFGMPLEALGPREMALRSVEAPDVEVVEKLEPTRWPVARRAS